MRGAIGQRLYFRDQTVTLPGVAARTDNTADILAALSGKLTSDLSIDTAWQYNPHSQATQRAVVAGRYQPGVNRLLNASYRFQRDVLKEIDISGQWPVYRGWYGVGRYNYSLREKTADRGNRWVRIQRRLLGGQICLPALRDERPDGNDSILRPVGVEWLLQHWLQSAQHAGPQDLGVWTGFRFGIRPRVRRL